jgi:hypothetical protein
MTGDLDGWISNVKETKTLSQASVLERVVLRMKYGFLAGVWDRWREQVALLFCCLL